MALERQTRLPARARGTQNSRKKAGNFWTHLVLSAAVLLVTSPLLFAFIKATQTSAQVTGPSLLPGLSFFENARAAWIGAELGRYMFNSTVVAVCVTLGKTVLSLLAALAFVYFRFPLKGLLFAAVLFALRSLASVIV